MRVNFTVDDKETDAHSIGRVTLPRSNGTSYSDERSNRTSVTKQSVVRPSYLSHAYQSLASAKVLDFRESCSTRRTQRSEIASAPNFDTPEWCSMALNKFRMLAEWERWPGFSSLANIYVINGKSCHIYCSCFSFVGRYKPIESTSMIDAGLTIRFIYRLCGYHQTPLRLLKHLLEGLYECQSRDKLNPIHLLYSLYFANPLFQINSRLLDIS